MSDVILVPPAVAVIGISGSGKTYSISTLLEAGLKVAVLCTEPGAVETLLDSCRDRKLDTSNLHYHQMTSAAPGWDAMFDIAKKVHGNSYAQLTEMKGVAKENMDHWLKFLQSCKNFRCDHCGADLGDVTELDSSWAFGVDSLSGMNRMAREYTVGYKPILHQGEWQVAQQLLDNIIFKLISDRKCFFFMITHVDRELDEVAGGTLITMSALGRKLGPQLTKYFSEIVLASQRDGKFVWSTMENNASVKARALRIGKDLPPSFVPIVKAHLARIQLASASPAMPTAGPSPATTT